jgi:hypothetical protein
MLTNFCNRILNRLGDRKVFDLRYVESRGGGPAACLLCKCSMTTCNKKRDWIIWRKIECTII